MLFRRLTSLPMHSTRLCHLETRAAPSGTSATRGIHQYVGRQSSASSVAGKRYSSHTHDSRVSTPKSIPSKMLVAPNLSGALPFENLPRGKQTWEASKNHQRVAAARAAFESSDDGVEEESHSRGGLFGWIHRQTEGHSFLGKMRCGRDSRRLVSL